MDVINDVKDVNFVNGLIGKVVGVFINWSFLGIGGVICVVMCGVKFIVGNNNVFYVVDGMFIGNFLKGEINNDYSILGGGEGIFDFNLEDIESLLILIGLVVVVLYGLLVVNGVILINIKKG